MRKALALFILLSCMACGQAGKVPGNVLPKEKMASVLLDMNLAEAYGRSYAGAGSAGGRPDTGRVADSVREVKVKVLYAQVLQLHDLTMADFMKSYHYYENHADRMEDVYKIMNDSAQAHSELAEKNRRAREEQHPIWEKWYPHVFHPHIPFLRGHF